MGRSVCYCSVYNYFDKGKVQDSDIMCKGVCVSLVYFSRLFAEWRSKFSTAVLLLLVFGTRDTVVVVTISLLKLLELQVIYLAFETPKKDHLEVISYALKISNRSYIRETHHTEQNTIEIWWTQS